ncbi:MAG TPA: ribonuclease PH [Kiritimatiellia bacterium]|nr:ribonuclease PH [Kiritimatiellia bacterium]
MTRSNTKRPDGRKPGVLRPVAFTPDFAPSALGSVLMAMGRTRVVCAVTVEDDVPRWMKQDKVAGGWLTAEYSMLPYASEDRIRREASSGKPSGRTQEIQRLIGRSLRAVVDLNKLGQRTLWVDCDVLQADGGTRTASITGAYAALRLAVDRLLADGRLTEDPIREAVAAVSVGIIDGQVLLDLCYAEDAAADVDMNVVMTASGKFVEVQGTAEERPFSADQLQAMLGLAGKGIKHLLAEQRKLRNSAA